MTSDGGDGGGDGERGVAERRLAALRLALETTPVPGARPRFSRADSATGLTLLELGLTMAHVVRLSESLDLVNERTMDRSVTVDLDLRSLTRSQRQALRSRLPSTGGPDDDTAASLLWVPIARLHHSDPGAVVVRDGSGSVVPRLPSAAITRVFAAGLSRFLELSIVGRVAESVREASAPALAAQARWLLVRAMEAVVDGRHLASAPPPAFPAPGPGPAAEPDDTGAEVRAQAQAYLADVVATLPDQAAELGYLLDVAAREQFVIVGLAPQASHVQLTYEAPSIPSRAVDVGLRRRVARMLHGYRVSYRTSVPSGVTSFHLTVRVPEELYAGRFVLATDSGATGVAVLAADLDYLAGRLETTGRVTAVFATDLTDVTTRLCALLRLRWQQAQTFRQATAAAVEPTGPREPTVDGVRSLRGFRGLASLLVAYDRGTLARTMTGWSPPDIVAVLRHLADQVRACDLTWDVYGDDDPRDHVVHARWHYGGVPYTRRGIEPLTARVTLTVTDESPALLDTVAVMIAGLVALTLVTAAVAPSKDQSDAVVTMLLLIPGIMLTRLGVTRAGSLIDQVRALPRRLAYLAVAVTSGLAAFIALYGGRSPLPWAGVAALVLLGGLAVTAIRRRRGWRSRSRPEPRTQEMPTWALDALAGAGGALPRPRYDVAWTRFNALTQEPGDAGRQPRLGPAGRARPAQAVRAAARAATEGSTAVRFTVTHRLPAQPTLGHDTADPAPAAADDVLGFRVLDASCRVELHRVPDPRRVVALSPLAGSERKAVPDAGPAAPIDVDAAAPVGEGAPGRAAVRADGTALLVPRPRYLGVHRSEVLLALSEEVDVSFCLSRRATSFLAELLTLVAETGATPLYLHYPAAPAPHRGTVDSDSDRRSVLPVMRLALANAGDRGGERFAFQEALLAAAAGRGVGVHLDKGRSSSRRQYWVPADGHGGRAAKGVPPLHRCRPGDGHDEHTRCGAAVTDAVLVTLAAPVAATGTGPLQDLTELLDAALVGCLGASVWSMHGTLVVNLLLAVPPGRAPAAAPAPATLEEVLAVCGGAQADPAAVARVTAGFVRLVLATPHQVVDAAPPPGHRFVAFWASWSVADDEDVDVLQRQLADGVAADPLCKDVLVLFVRASRTGTDRVQGRAKLRVCVPEGVDADDLGLLADRSQERLVATRRAQGHPPSDLDGLLVSSGEYWLGPGR